MTARSRPQYHDHLAVEDQPYLDVLLDTLAYARERDYIGWDYADGMSSRFRRWLPVEHKWLNLAFQESVKRLPVNLRPLLLVEQRRNFKGAALFAMANGTADRLTGGSSQVAGDVDFAGESVALLDWLVANRCRGYRGFCVGHSHPIQQLDWQKQPDQPGIVATSFAVKALLRGAALDPTYAGVASTAADFVVEDLDYREVEGGAKVKYHQLHTDAYYTVNAGALGARLFLDLYAHRGGDDLLDRATKILDYVAAVQTDLGGWTYRLPPSASHLSMDNHHNGFIIECLLRYREVTGSSRYDDTIDTSLAFYRDVLYEPDGAPNWDETSRFPRDIHAAAVGIIVFTYAGQRDVARRIVDWVLEYLYAGDGRFYYRRYRWYTNRTTLMRWCEAWMAYALAEFLAAGAGTDDGA